MKYKVSHTTKYEYSELVPVCRNLVHLEPRTLPNQQCHDFRLAIQPRPHSVAHRTDYFGNHVSHFSIERPHRQLMVTAESRVEVLPTHELSSSETPSWEQVAIRLRNAQSESALDAFQFTKASEAIRLSDDLLDYAKSSFEAGQPILAAVMDLTHRIYEEFAYDTRATTVHTPIEEVFENRQGVCQDFAHLEIGCLRSLGLAARYVSGYLRTIPPPGKPRLVGADASHAWISVFCGEKGWVDVDPTNNTRASTDYITLAWGRDYDDVCPIQGVIVGGGNHQMSVSVDVEPVELAPRQESS